MYFNKKKGHRQERIFLRNVSFCFSWRNERCFCKTQAINSILLSSYIYLGFFKAKKNLIKGSILWPLGPSLIPSGNNQRLLLFKNFADKKNNHTQSLKVYFLFCIKITRVNL